MAAEARRDGLSADEFAFLVWYRDKPDCARFVRRDNDVFPVAEGLVAIGYLSYCDTYYSEHDECYQITLTGRAVLAEQ
jgi:hypothetical protein